MQFSMSRQSSIFNFNLHFRDDDDNVHYYSFNYLFAGTKQAIEVIKGALNDETVRTGRRYSLLLRAKKICNSSVVKKLNKTLWNDFAEDPMISVQDAPTVR